MKVLYLATTGAGDATKASLPLHIAANGSWTTPPDLARMTEQLDRVVSV